MAKMDQDILKDSFDPDRKNLLIACVFKKKLYKTSTIKLFEPDGTIEQQS